MTELKCDVCGGKLLMQPNGLARCQSCGLEYAKETLQAKISVSVTGPVEVVQGEGEKERLLKNAQTYLMLEKYDEAADLYALVAKEYPDDYRGWWGLVTTYFQRVGLTGKWDISGIQPLTNVVPATRLRPELSDEYRRRAEALVRGVLQEDIIPVMLQRETPDGEWESCFDAVRRTEAALAELPENDPVRRFLQEGLACAEDAQDRLFHGAKTIDPQHPMKPHGLAYQALARIGGAVASPGEDSPHLDSIAAVLGKFVLTEVYGYRPGQTLLLPDGWEAAQAEMFRAMEAASSFDQL